ncbi:MAG: hypothetical protein KAG64_06740 [Bacteroidales bacterium]|nr:hypothetical protein [Bacteroidales bacterium]
MSKIYKIEQFYEQGSKIIAHLSIDENHPIFDGHFPQRSVLPGVIQLEIIKEVLSCFMKSSYKVQSIKNAKYLAMILPDENRSFSTELDYIIQDDQSVKIKAVIKNSSKVFLKFSGVFIKNNE